MSTDPILGMLDREGSIEASHELIDIACPVLREVVNQATHVDQRCERYASGERDVDLPAFTLFRQIMEATDGMEVLLSSSCVQPCELLLRSSFEASLELGYLVETNFRRRALSWVYCNLQHRIRDYENQHPDSQKGGEFWDAWKEEIGKLPDLDLSEFNELAEGLRQVAREERFTEIAIEYENVGGRPHWFRLFDGPSNRRELAGRLGRLTEYDTFYGTWSTYAHGRSWSHFIDAGASIDKGRTIANSLRYGIRLPDVAVTAITLMIGGMEILLSHYRPAESLGPWVEREISEDLARLRELEIEETPDIVDLW